MTFSDVSIAALCVWLVPLSLCAQEQSGEASRRWLIGIRFEAFPSSLFTTRSAQSSTMNPIADYSYSGSSDSPELSVGPAGEFRLSERLSVGLEFRFHHAQYQQVTEMRSGKPDPNSISDDRLKSTYTETTKANYYEVPALVHYYIFHPDALSTVYASAGMEYRHVGRVRTGTTFAYADGSEDYNEIPATPHQTNQVGFVAGLGLRFVSYGRLRTTPELRYIHWRGTTFQETAIRSARGQIEFGLGFSF